MWLLTWTLVTSLLQLAVFQADPATWVLLGAFGASALVEVTMLARMALGLVQAAGHPGTPTIELRHEGLTARWSLGDGSLLGVAFGLGQAALSFGLLFSSAAVGLLVPQHPWAPVLGALLVGVWALCAGGWLVALDRQRRSRGTATLIADLDRVQVTFVGPRAGRSQTLALRGLRLRSEQGAVSLTDGEGIVELPLRPGPEADELLQLLHTMAERSTQTLEAAVPPGLQQLRARQVQR